MPQRVLIIDADRDSRRALSTILSQEGLDPIEELESGEGLAGALLRRPALIVLSEGLPSLDGVGVLSLVRRKTDAPIIVVGDGLGTSLVNALLEGADVYLQTPVEPEELVGRVRAVLRRSHTQAKPEGAASNWELPGRVESSLTRVEERLLRCLMERQGYMVGHEELMSRVWGGPVSPARLRFYIHSLRRKLSSGAPWSLQTQKGIGYRLVQAASY